MNKNFSILFLLTFGLSVINLHAQISFQDITETAGLSTFGPNYGIAIGDYDNDGWEDIYLTKWIGPNKLYRNLGNGTFENVAKAEGLNLNVSSKVATWGDFNNDGLLDLFVGNQDEPDLLFQNLGSNPAASGNRFKQVPLPEAAEDAHVMAALWADVDLDGFTDLYIVRSNSPNTLYKNEKGQFFIDATIEANVQDDQLSMGAIFFDYDQDLDPDLYLVHDGYQANILYQNDGTGHFKDVAEEVGADVKSFGMGVDVADINHDGWLDIYITNLYANSFLLNDGKGNFLNISDQTGTDDIGMGWGTAFFDCDNDGWQDVYVANTIGKPNVLYRNLHNGSFENSSEGQNIALGGNSFVMAHFDFDQDGRQDFVVSNSQDDIGFKLFQNTNKIPNNWLGIECMGIQSNRLGIGSRVEVWVDGDVQIDEVISSSGYASQNSLHLHFGLGQSPKVDSVIVYWPNGLTDKLLDLEANQLIKIREGDSENIFTSIPNPIAKLSYNIYPNPANDILWLNLNIESAQTFSVQIFELNGRKVLNFPARTSASGDYHFPIKLSQLSKGIYLFRLQTESLPVFHKVFIKN